MEAGVFSAQSPAWQDTQDVGNPCGPDLDLNLPRHLCGTWEFFHLDLTLCVQVLSCTIAHHESF